MIFCWEGDFEETGVNRKEKIRHEKEHKDMLSKIKYYL